MKANYEEVFETCRRNSWQHPSRETFGMKPTCRYGVVWSPPEAIHARDMFEAGHHAAHIAIVHGRDVGGIVAKLRAKGWYNDLKDNMTKHGTNLDYRKYEYTFGKVIERHTLNTQKEEIMDNNTPEVNLNSNKPIVEQVTMVRGQDVRKLKPAHLIGIIREIETEMRDLQSFTVTSKYISTRITQLQEDLTKVVEVLDSM